MQTIIRQLDTAFRAAIRAAFEGLDADPLVAQAQNAKFGDYQSNAAMSLAKLVAERTGQKTNPRAVAEAVIGKLDLGDMTDGKPDKSWIAGPGFINVKLSGGWLTRQLRHIAADERLGVEPVAQPQRVVVDYSAPNIAKEMHVGHIRSTIIGDAIARTLAFRGDEVIRQNHLGDWGTQFGRVLLAMWYEAAFQATNQYAKLDALIRAGPGASTVSELGALHQQFVDADHDGRKYFLPYVESGTLKLDELERVYAFVSGVTESEAARSVIIRHPIHGERALADIPRLVTTFIQNPAVPVNSQERLAWEMARRVTMSTCREVYQRLNVQLADDAIQSEPMERGESFYNPFLPEVVRDLVEKDVAVRSEGAVVIRVPGFEFPLVIQKADGGYLYGTTDLAAVRFRVRELHATRILYFVDARQKQHFAQVFWAANKAGYSGQATLEHAWFGTMLGKDGKPFKTRSGDTVKLRELLDEAEERALAAVTQKNPEMPETQRVEIARAVGIGAVKYADLSKDRVSDYVFDWDAMLSFDGNTAPYIQYAHARIKSIFRRAGVKADGTKVGVSAPEEAALAKHILRFGEVIESVARESKPHLLCTYLYELATQFSAFFESCPVLKSEEPTRAQRLALCDVTARTLSFGLSLLGIESPEQM